MTMIANYPNVRVVFDRKHVATAKKKGLVQVEVQQGGRKRYITTGVKVFAGCWKAQGGVTGCMDADVLNQRVSITFAQVQGYINKLMAEGRPFSWERFNGWVDGGCSGEESFFDFVRRFMEERTDIRESTRKQHRKLLTAMEEFGGLDNYADLTKGRIYEFDAWLHRKRVNGKPISDAGVHNYHKLLKSYINEAIRREQMDVNPYSATHFKRGEAAMKSWLDESDLRRLRRAHLPTESLRRVRDYALLQFFTGLAYSDLFSLRRDMFTKKNGRMVLSGERMKSGVRYYVVLLPEAVELLERYGWELPPMSNQQYNMRLKIVGEAAGIDKPLTSHCFRRSAGMWFLNQGMSIEVVARILGHSDIKTTQKHYAHLLNSSVDAAFERLF